MTNWFYKTLGFVTWQGLKLLHRAEEAPRARCVLGGLVAAAIVAGRIGAGVAKREELTALLTA